MLVGLYLTVIPFCQHLALNPHSPSTMANGRNEIKNGEFNDYCKELGKFLLRHFHKPDSNNRRESLQTCSGPQVHNRDAPAVLRKYIAHCNDAVNRRRFWN